MLGEYEYYIKKDVTSAIRELSESLKKSYFKYYSYKALYELYNNQGQYAAAEQLKAKYDKDHYAIDEIQIL